VRWDLDGDTDFVASFHLDRPVGELRIFYANGRLASITNRDSKGDEYGWQHKFDTTGKHTSSWCIHSQTWVDSVKYDEYGNVVSRIQYVNKKKNGIAWYYWKQDSLAPPADTFPVESFVWKDNVRDGAHKKYHHRVNYYHEVYTNGVLTESKTGYYRGGYIRVWNGERVMNGKFVLVTRDGHKILDQNFLNGCAFGKQYTYDSITHVLLEEQSVGEKHIDTVKQFAQNGQLIYFKVIHLVADSHYYSIDEYYDTGELKAKSGTSNDVLWGSTTHYYRDGKVWMKGSYKWLHLDDTIQVWNPSGVLVFESKCCMGRDTLPEKIWSDAGKPLKVGTKAYEEQLQKCLPEGVRRYSKTDPFVYEPIFIVAFKNSKWTGGKTSVGHFQRWNTDEYSEYAPHFVGGVNGRHQYFDAAVYPQTLIDSGIGDTLRVRFTVEADSTITNVYVVDSANAIPLLAEKSVFMVANMPKWVPCMRNGKAVRAEGEMEFIWKVK
jgi:antitoxin component YwqK of YwqJK toxin-antitoxin module